MKIKIAAICEVRALVVISAWLKLTNRRWVVGVPERVAEGVYAGGTFSLKSLCV
jgi:hypothetical protein